MSETVEVDYKKLEQYVENVEELLDSADSEDRQRFNEKVHNDMRHNVWGITK